MKEIQEIQAAAKSLAEAKRRTGERLDGLERAMIAKELKQTRQLLQQLVTLLTPKCDHCGAAKETR
jgi:hypothetical protein